MQFRFESRAISAVFQNIWFGLMGQGMGNLWHDRQNLIQIVDLSEH
jgi:hypothetical protein